MPTIYIICVTGVIVQTPPIQDYYVNDVIKSVYFPAYTIVPAACPAKTFVSSVKQTDDSALPTGITFYANDPIRFFVYTASPTNTGQYSLKVNAYV